MNLFILTTELLFVVACLLSYDAWHSKHQMKPYAVMYGVCAIGEFILLTLFLELAKL